MSPHRVAANWGPALRVLGLPLHPVAVEDVHAFITQAIRADEKALVLNLNVNCVNLAQSRPWLRELLGSAQLVFCDGDGVRLGLRLLGVPPPPKITYDRWIWQLAEHASEEGHSLYFLGARPGVAEAAAEKLRARHPALRIVGVRDGYFERAGNANEAVIAEINRVRPDILVVGFGMPEQERWLSDHWTRIDARIFLAGGAVFDYASGRAPRAPDWMIRAELEWLHRFSQEPRRLFVRYALGNPLFLCRVLVDGVRRGTPPTGTTPRR